MTETRTLRRTLEVPARQGIAFEVAAGELVRVIDVEGKQVGDLTAYDREGEAWFSPVHTRGMLNAIRLSVGDCLYSARRLALLKVVEDDVGRHDILFPACDQRRYELDYGEPGHANCRDNLRAALADHGLELQHPEPLNLFMNVPLEPDGTFEIAEPLSEPGDGIAFQVERPLVIALSACPMDLNPCNGWNPTGLRVELFAGERRLQTHEQEVQRWLSD